MSIVNICILIAVITCINRLIILARDKSRPEPLEELGNFIGTWIAHAVLFTIFLFLINLIF
jgi:hypothetical protein